MQKLGRVLPSALVLFLGLASAGPARATEVLSVTDKRIEVRLTGDLSVSAGQLYYLLDNDYVRRGIIKVESVIDDVAFGELMMGNAEPQMKLELRNRKSAHKSRASSRAPASEGSETSLLDRSEYFWLPKAGHFSLEGYLTTMTSTYGYISNNTALAVTDKANQTRLMAMYSFSEKYTLGVLWDVMNSETANYTYGSTTDSLSASGAGDPTLVNLYHSDDGSATYFFGLNLSVNLGPKKTATASQKGNFSSGGIVISPLLGLLIRANENHYFGTQITYSYPFTRNIDNQDGTTSQATGGAVLTADVFYEFHYEGFLVSPIMGFENSAPSSTSSSNGTSSSNSGGTGTHWESVFGYAFTPEFEATLSVISKSMYIPGSAGSPASAAVFFGYRAGLRYEF